MSAPPTNVLDLIPNRYPFDVGLIAGDIKISNSKIIYTNSLFSLLFLFNFTIYVLVVTVK